MIVELSKKQERQLIADLLDYSSPAELEVLARKVLKTCQLTRGVDIDSLAQFAVGLTEEGQRRKKSDAAYKRVRSRDDRKAENLEEWTDI